MELSRRQIITSGSESRSARIARTANVGSVRKKHAMMPMMARALRMILLREMRLDQYPRCVHSLLEQLGTDWYNAVGHHPTPDKSRVTVVTMLLGQARGAQIMQIIRPRKNTVWSGFEGNDIMADVPSKECLVCLGSDCLVPLYSSKLPEAQPVAYVHHRLPQRWCTDGRRGAFDGPVARSKQGGEADLAEEGNDMTIAFIHVHGAGRKRQTRARRLKRCARRSETTVAAQKGKS
jgi:hypothetical protein